MAPSLPDALMDADVAPEIAGIVSRKAGIKIIKITKLLKIGRFIVFIVMGPIERKIPASFPPGWQISWTEAW